MLLEYDRAMQGFLDFTKSTCLATTKTWCAHQRSVSTSWYERNGSDNFLRGSRQGDPISPVLFNAVLEDVLRTCKEKWHSRGWGWSLGEIGDNLTNLRFADDLLLIGRSLHQATEMLKDIIREAQLVGLSVHFGKTCILHNGKGQDIRKQDVDIEGEKVKILQVSETTAYLGANLRLSRRMEAEVSFRMSRAWAKFATFRAELTNKKYNLYHRVRLFNTVVTPCALYGCGSWALTQQEEQQVRVTQRRMLRAILNRPRRVYESSESDSTVEEEVAEDEEVLDVEERTESWTDWLKRTTVEATDVLQKVGAEDWVTQLRKRKWLWAGKVCQHSLQRRTSKILRWSPQEGIRSVGHPTTRRWDQLNEFTETVPGFEDHQGAWQVILQSSEIVEALLQEFLAFCEH